MTYTSGYGPLHYEKGDGEEGDGKDGGSISRPDTSPWPRGENNYALEENGVTLTLQRTEIQSHG